ncbi:MAG: low-specificity L-threonine aldolase [Flavobacteriales bacterium]
MIDLRSDTFTKPTAEMLDYMFRAEVGDDVFCEDSTVNALEEKVASLFQKEAALFCPSGTMANQIAIKVHTQPGDEVICAAQAHIYYYEGGGISFNSSASVKLIDNPDTFIYAEDIKSKINPDDVHFPRTRLVAVENTTNRGGGRCYSFDELTKISAICREQGLAFHVDGARLFNALVAKGETPKQYGAIFDSISICLSKGLGAPVGSVLIGDKVFIKQARRVRKVFGGGMRQAGYLAAAGIYALDNQVNRLAEDHLHAQQLREALLDKSYVNEVFPVETNIVIFTTKGVNASTLLDELSKHQIKAISMGVDKMRLVTHLGVSKSDIEHAIQVLKNIDGKEFKGNSSVYSGY